MGSFGNWVLSYQSMFLENRYLKYLGWMLSDQCPAVRLRCLDALVSLLEDKDAALALDDFVDRFKPRILGMTADVDDKVAVRAYKFLTLVEYV